MSAHVDRQKPTLQIYLEPVGGVAGDMFIAAVLDAFPELQPGLLDAVRAAGVPQCFDVSTTEHRDHALTGLRFLVQPADNQEAEADGDGHRSHATFAEVRDMLESALVDSEVRSHAIGIFELLAEAEARVHGTSAEEVSFHELGEWDSIADIVGAAYLIASLGAHWSIGPLPLGGGRVRSAHGHLPAPAPATALLLTGFAIVDDGVAGERVTPTGAAILRYLKANRPQDRRPRVLYRIGTGFGSRELPGRSNVLRLLAFDEDERRDDDRDQVAEILFDVDDQTMEDLALALDRLRAHAGVIDVLQAPAFGKKGRIVACIRVLARPPALDSVIDACFRETTTLGMRYHFLERRLLKRRQGSVVVEGREIGVKVVQRPGGNTAKAEAESLRNVAGGHSDRERHRDQAGRAALTEQDQ